jgi:hypothetical protein
VRKKYEFDFGAFFMLLFIIAVCLFWASQLMAAEREWRFWYSEIRGNSRICYYQGPNAPTLIIGVQERCPSTL